MTHLTNPKKTCPHCGAPSKKEARIPPHLVSATLALAAAFFYWNAGGGAQGAAGPMPGSNLLPGEILSHITSPSADSSCQVCLTSANKFLGEQKAAELRKKTNNMVRIPPGEHKIGSPDGVGDPDERPQRQIYLDAFYIDKNETTIAEYMRFARDTSGNYPEWAQPGGKFNIETGKEPYYKRLAGLLKTCTDCPAIGVTAKNAEAYCGSRNKRLPTEAEWEAAARGGTDSEFSFGNDPSAAGDSAWYDKNSEQTPHPVGQKKPNPYGLHDMHGNVWEWVSNFYEKWDYKESPKRNPKGPETGTEHVIRGGAWSYDAAALRSANRASNAKPNDDIGFRCAISESAVPGMAARE